MLSNTLEADLFDFKELDISPGAISEYEFIEYFEEAQGFSKIEAEDPCLIRMVAKRR